MDASLAREMPTDAEAYTSRPGGPSSTNGVAKMPSIRSASAIASRSPSRASQSTTNSSAPKRATVSAGLRTYRMRWDSSTRKSSPELWPRLSFTCLKRSTSMKSTASKPATRLSRRTAPERRSSSSARLGSPVSGSKRALRMSWLS